MEKFKLLDQNFTRAFYEDDFLAMKMIYRLMKDVKNFEELAEKCCSEEFKKFRKDKKSVKYVHDILFGGGWKNVRESDSIKIECQGGGNAFLTKCTLSLNCNIFHVLAVISEADLIHTWVEPLRDIKIFEQPTKTRILQKYQFSFPWPLSERHCMIEVHSVPMNQAVSIVLKTPEEKYYLGKKIFEGNGGETWMRINVGCIFVEYLEENKTRLIIMTSCDPNINFLPNFILNFATKHALYYMMETLKSKISNLKGSIYEQRISERKEFYSFLQEMLGQYIP